MIIATYVYNDRTVVVDYQECIGLQGEDDGFYDLFDAKTDEHLNPGEAIWSDKVPTYEEVGWMVEANVPLLPSQE